MKKYFFALALIVALAFIPYKTMSSTKSDSKVITLTDKNTLVLNSEVTPESVSKIVLTARELDKNLTGMTGFKEKVTSKEPLYLVLNTPGGSVQAGLELIESINGLGRPVHTITVFAASMGFQIAQNFNTRYILKSGVLMSHRAKGGFQGEFGGQYPSQIDSRYALWKSRIDELDAQTVARSNGKQTMESYQKQYASEMWLTGTQSTEQGYADAVVFARCDSSLLGVEHREESVDFFGGSVAVKYDLDKCPTNTSPMNAKVKFPTNKGTYVTYEEFSKQGGVFGSACLVESANDDKKICALDSTMGLSKIREIEKNFMSQYENTSKLVVNRL